MNNNYLNDVSCYDCQNCTLNNIYDSYCKNACMRCGPILNNIMWYNPSQFPYANYYGSYINGYLSPNLLPFNRTNKFYNYQN